MEFQEVFAQLRQRTGLSQSEVAERLFVTRQAAGFYQAWSVPDFHLFLLSTGLFSQIKRDLNTDFRSPFI